MTAGPILPAPDLRITNKLGDRVSGTSTVLRKGDNLYTEARIQSAVNAALEWAAKKADSESDLAQTARDMAKSDEIAAVFHQRVWASRKIATAIRAAIKESPDA